MQQQPPRPRAGHGRRRSCRPERTGGRVEPDVAGAREPDRGESRAVGRLGRREGVVGEGEGRPRVDEAGGGQILRGKRAIAPGLRQGYRRGRRRERDGRGRGAVRSDGSRGGAGNAHPDDHHRGGHAERRRCDRDSPQHAGRERHTGPLAPSRATLCGLATPSGERVTVGASELRQHAGDVRLYRRQRDAEAVRDLGVREPLAQRLEDAPLRRRQHVGMGRAPARVSSPVHATSLRARPVNYLIPRRRWSAALAARSARRIRSVDGRRPRYAPRSDSIACSGSGRMTTRSPTSTIKTRSAFHRARVGAGSDTRPFEDTFMT